MARSYNLARGMMRLDERMTLLEKPLRAPFFSKLFLKAMASEMRKQLTASEGQKVEI